MKRKERVLITNASRPAGKRKLAKTDGRYLQGTLRVCGGRFLSGTDSHVMEEKNWKMRSAWGQK